MCRDSAQQRGEGEGEWERERRDDQWVGEVCSGVCAQADSLGAIVSESLPSRCTAKASTCRCYLSSRRRRLALVTGLRDCAGN